MEKQVDIEKLGMSLEDLEDIKVEIEDLVDVPLGDVRKEIKKISKLLASVIQDIDYEVGDAYMQSIEKK